MGTSRDLPHPCVVTPWGSDVLPDQGAYREWYSKGLTGRLLRRADLVTTHSSYMEAQVRALVPDVRAIVRVGWGVDLQRFRPNIDTASLRRRWGIQADQPVVFSPRLLQPLYNHEYIIQALPRLRRAIPNVIVVFTDYFADLAYKRRLQRLAADLDVTESIRFIGEVSHEEMPYLVQPGYSRHDDACFRRPSEFSAGSHGLWGHARVERIAAIRRACARPGQRAACCP